MRVYGIRAELRFPVNKRPEDLVVNNTSNVIMRDLLHLWPRSRETGYGESACKWAQIERLYLLIAK